MGDYTAFSNDRSYVGENVLTKVMQTTMRTQPDITIGFDFDDTGMLDQYGVGIGLDHKGLYMRRMETRADETTFDLYRFGSRANNVFKGLQAELGEDWQYAFVRTDWVVDNAEVPMEDSYYDPETDVFTHAVEQKLNSVLRDLQNPETEVHVLPGEQDIPEPLHEIVKEPGQKDSYTSTSSE